MTTTEGSALTTLLVIRERSRESAEQAFGASLRAIEEAEESVRLAREAFDAHRTHSNDALEIARSGARNGADYLAYEALARAARDDATRLRAVIDAADVRVREALRGSEKARAQLAQAEAEEKAVRQRIEAAQERDRAIALGREDDEADERAAGPRRG